VKVVRTGDVRRILVLNRNHIGDCLLTTPMLRALKRRFPRAHIAVAVPASNRDLLVTNPHVDEIVIRPEIQSWAAKIRFALETRRGHYDLIISVQEKSKFYGWAAWYSKLCNPKMPVTVALDHPRTRRFYQHVSPIHPEQHEVYKYLDVATMLGCPRERNPVLELEPTAEARDNVRNLLTAIDVDGDARFIGINPGGSKEEKRWPVERFAEVGDRLQAELGLPVIIFGGAADADRAQAIADGMSQPAFVVAGRASLGDTAAFLERCRLLVTGDTGPMHMAVAMAVPVVALFGPTNPVKFGPFSTHKTVLRHEGGCAQCQRPCLHTISVDECVEAALKLYAVTGPGPHRRRRGNGVPLDPR